MNTIIIIIVIINTIIIISSSSSSSSSSLISDIVLLGVEHLEVDLEHLGEGAERPLRGSTCLMPLCLIRPRLFSTALLV